jgi:sugar lactone lactonase YvrE
VVEVSVVADFGDLCGECPVWNDKESALEWIDCVGDNFLTIAWPSRKSRISRKGVKISGLRRNRAGGYVITNSQGIWLWDGAEKYDCLAREVGGRPCQANDCVADSAGRFITATYYYNPAGAYDLGSLISVNTNGKVTVLDNGFHLANGLGLSPSEDRLYFADSAARQIFVYDYDVSSGAAHNRRIFVQVPHQEGLPDGLAVDAEGCIWSAQWYGSSIVRYDPTGKLIRRVQIPAKQTSSLAFGGAELMDIFVTSASQSEPMLIMPPGYDAQSGTFGGALYHVNLGIRGLPQHRPNIGLRD